MSAEAVFEALVAQWGPARVTRDPARLAPHLEEWRGRGTGETPFLAEPQSTEDVAACVLLCKANGVAITPQGGNTGLVLGQMPRGEIVVSLRRLNKIRHIDPTADALVAEAGVILSTAQDAARAVDRIFPLSLAAQGSATIGGLVSTNAGGVHVLRYGMMRDLVLGIEAVMPDGRILSALNALRKDNTGYDLKQLLIGSEGTLGIVTAATLRLFPKPAEHVVAMVAPRTPDHALNLLHRLKAQTSAVSAFELMNRNSVAYALALPGVRHPLSSVPAWTALIEFEGASGLRTVVEGLLADALEAGVIEDAAIAQTLEAEASFWKLRENLPAGHRVLPRPQVNHDTSTPVSCVPEFLARADAEAQRLSPGSEVVAFGHAGDGNIHLCVIGPDHETFPAAAINDAIHSLAVSLGGSISAEHGIGVSRKADFARFKDPVTVDLMRTLKRTLDPDNILNPRLYFE